MAKYRPSSDAHRRAVSKYNKENSRTFSVSLLKHSEADVLEYLDSLPNKRAYFINLIREEIKRQGGNGREDKDNGTV